MDNQVIIVIGLPASGKSTYVNNTFKDEYIIFDDFLQYFYKGDILRHIKKGDKVCLIDPRLCEKDNFDNIIKKIEVITDDIYILLFRNDKELSIRQSKMRNDKQKDNLALIRYIEAVSDIYDYSNYDNYNYHIVN